MGACTPPYSTYQAVTHIHTQTHTCDEAVFPSDRGHMVAVDVPFKLEHLGRLEGRGGETGTKQRQEASTLSRKKTNVPCPLRRWDARLNISDHEWRTETLWSLGEAGGRGLNRAVCPSTAGGNNANPSANTSPLSVHWLPVCVSMASRAEPMDTHRDPSVWTFTQTHSRAHTHTHRK